MNRHQMISQTLLWEQIAAKAKAKAAGIRDQLAADARAELAEQGTAPTWRLPDIGTVTLPVSQETVYIADEQALIAFLKAEPGDPNEVIETVERVRPSYAHDLLTMVQVFDGRVGFDDGTVVPGLAVHPGGQPGTLTFRPTWDAKQVAAAVAEKLIIDLEGHLTGPVVLADNMGEVS